MGRVRHTSRLAEGQNLKGWHQHRHHTNQVIKRAFNRVNSVKKGRPSPERVVAYLHTCERFLERARETLEQAERCGSQAQIFERDRVRHFMKHAERQIDQVRRRLLKGEQIPRPEKVFSVFEEHTRWVVKGKGGVCQELGVPVCVLEDQYRLILHHQILWDGHDVDYACNMVSETQARFPELRACSFDRGFHSPDNQRRLGVLLDECRLPVKGYLNAQSAARQSEEWFRNARQLHPAVESAINHLEHCGLARIRSRGRAGFARSVSWSVLSANIKRLGRLLRDQERKRWQRRKRLRAA